MVRPPGKLPINGPGPCAVEPRTHPVTPEPWDVSEGDPASPWKKKGRWCRGMDSNHLPPGHQAAAHPYELPLHMPGEPG